MTNVRKKLSENLWEPNVRIREQRFLFDQSQHGEMYILSVLVLNVFTVAWSWVSDDTNDDRWCWNCVKDNSYAGLLSRQINCINTVVVQPVYKAYQSSLKKKD